MRRAVCREMRAICSQSTCAFTANFDGGFIYNGEHAGAIGMIRIVELVVVVSVLHRPFNGLNVDDCRRSTHCYILRNLPSKAYTGK